MYACSWDCIVREKVEDGLDMALYLIYQSLLNKMLL